VLKANEMGGTFFGGAYKLGAKVRVSKRGYVFVYGTPAGAWVIKSYGRRESKTKVAHLGSLGFRSLKSDGAAATSGDGRWDRVGEFAEDHSPLVFAQQVHRAVEG